MLPDRPLQFVDSRGEAFIELKTPSHGCGHPSQQFLYQPAVDTVLREGVDRFHNVDVLLSPRMSARGNGHSRRCRADAGRPETDSFLRMRASYVIAADGGIEPDPRPARRRLHGAHLRGTLGRHRHQGARGMGRPRQPALPLRPCAPDRRLPHPAGASPLGVPRAAGDAADADLISDAAVWQHPARPGHHREKRPRSCAR